MNFDTVHNRFHGYEAARLYFASGADAVKHMLAYPASDGGRPLTVSELRATASHEYQQDLAKIAAGRALTLDDPIAVYSSIGWCILKAHCAGLDLRKRKDWKTLGVTPDQLRNAADRAIARILAALSEKTILRALGSTKSGSDFDILAQDITQWAIARATLRGNSYPPMQVDVYREMNTAKTSFDHRLLQACFSNPDLNPAFMSAMCRAFRIQDIDIQSVFNKLPKSRQAALHTISRKHSGAACAFNIVKQVQPPSTATGWITWHRRRAAYDYKLVPAGQ